MPSLGVFVDTHSPEVAGAVNAAVTQLNEENTSHSSDSQATIMNIISAERYERPGTKGKASAMRIKVQLRRENGRMEASFAKWHIEAVLLCEGSLALQA